jgi:hypothetical protein
VSKCKNDLKKNKSQVKELRQRSKKERTWVKVNAWKVSRGVGEVYP